MKYELKKFSYFDPVEVQHWSQTFYKSWTKSSKEVAKSGNWSLLYKSWTYEVQLIQKYLTNPEVSCLKSALKWSWIRAAMKRSLAKPEVKHESSAFSQRSQNQGSITEVLKEVHIHPSLKLKSSSLWGCSKYKIHWKCEVITSHQSIYLALQKGVVEAEVPGLRVVSALPRTQVEKKWGTVWCLQLSCEVHPCSGKFQLGEVHILGTVKEEATVPSVPHPPSLALKSIVHSSSFKSKCHIDKSIVEMCWKLGSKSLLQVLLKSHPNSPQVKTYAASQVHAEVDHPKAMFQEVWLQHFWKSDSLTKLTVGKLSHLQWSEPCRDNCPKISLQKYPLSLVPQVVIRRKSRCEVGCFIDLGVDEVLLRSVDRSRKWSWSTTKQEGEQGRKLVSHQSTLKWHMRKCPAQPESMQVLLVPHASNPKGVVASDGVPLILKLRHLEVQSLERSWRLWANSACQSSRLWR